MELFEVAHKFTAKWEKGLVDHPADPGGITKNGISLRFLQGYEKTEKEWLKEIGIKLPVTAASVRALTQPQEEAIYKRAFWEPLQPEKLPPLTVMSFYDASVNSGQKQATKFLQRACNVFTGEQITVDGALGPKTRARAMDIWKAQGKDLLLAQCIIEFRDGFYRGLAESKPSNNVFLKGWLNRTNDLRNYLSTVKV